MPSQSAAHKVLVATLGSTSAVLSVLPSYLVFKEGAYAPPGYEPLFGTVIAVCSLVTLLLVTLYRKRIGRMRPGRVVRVSGAIVVIGLAALATYAFARARAVCPGPGDDEVYVLLFPPATVVRAGREHEGVCRAVLASETAQDIRQEVLNSPGRRFASNAVFLSLYVIMNVAVVSVLAVAGWRVARDEPPAPESPV